MQLNFPSWVDAGQITEVSNLRVDFRYSKSSGTWAKVTWQNDFEILIFSSFPTDHFSAIIDRARQPAQFSKTN